MSAVLLLVTGLVPALLAMSWRRPTPARVGFPRTSNRRGRDAR